MESTIVYFIISYDSTPAEQQYKKPRTIEYRSRLKGFDYDHYYTKLTEETAQRVFSRESLRVTDLDGDRRFLSLPPPSSLLCPPFAASAECIAVHSVEITSMTGDRPGRRPDAEKRSTLRYGRLVGQRPTRGRRRTGDLKNAAEGPSAAVLTHGVLFAAVAMQDAALSFKGPSCEPHTKAFLRDRRFKDLDRGKRFTE